MSQQAFQVLLNSLTTEERERVMKVAMAYGLGPDDPGWIILAINQTGLMAMEKTVTELSDLHNKEIAAFRQKAQKLANVAMEKAAQAAVQKISNTLANAAQNLYYKRELKVTTGWTVCASIIGVTFYIGITLLTYEYLESTLYKKALTDAYQIAYDEKARASWGNTAIGKMAYQLSQVTDIQQLVQCNNPGSGWRLNADQSVCFPHSNSEGQVYGWSVPKVEN